MKKLLSFILLFISISSNAQHSFTAWVTSVSGSCNTLEDKVTVGIIQQTAAHRSSTNYPSYDICEDMRRNIMEGYSSGSCTVRVATTRCTPSKGAGAVDISGPSQGYSFYSSNPADEVYNWSSDDIERHLAFDQNYQVNMPKAIKTNDDSFNRERALARENGNWYLDTDKPFVSVNMREGGFSKTDSDDFSMKKKLDKATDFSFLANSANVQRYVKASKSLTEVYVANPQDLTQLLHDEFKAVSGFDLDAIMQKLPSERTKAEKQALLDYQEYKKQITDLIIKEINIKANEIAKELDMAVLSEDSYTYSKHNNLDLTNYRMVSSDFFPEGSEMKNFSKIIQLCNSTDIFTGFHAELYYNDITDEYTVAFEGSNLEFKESFIDALSSTSMQPIRDIVYDWLETNALQGVGGIPPQYILAGIIGMNIPNNVKINLTGHSLGGGLASVAGAISGNPTYTFNAEGVNKNIITVFGLNDKIEKQDYDIHAIRSADDPLTSFQEGDLKAPITDVIIGTVSTLPVIGPFYATKLRNDVQTEKVDAPAIGQKKQYDTGEGHGIDGFIRKLSYSNETYKAMKKDIYEHGHGVERQTQDSILIITDN